MTQTKRIHRDAAVTRQPRCAVAQRKHAMRRTRTQEKLDQIRGRYGPRWWLPWASGALTLAGLTLLGVTTHAAIAASWMNVLRDDRFVLDAVEVMGADQMNAGEIVRALALPTHVALVDLDPQLLEARLATHPHVAAATVLRFPPSKLLVQVRERSPVAVVFLPGQRQPYLVDGEGRPCAPAGPLHLSSELPLLETARPTALGEPNEALALAVELARALGEHGIDAATRIVIGAEGDAEGTSLLLGEGEQRVILGTRDFDAKLARLRALREAELPEVAAAKEIDLRFRDQVVLRSQPSSNESGKSGGHAWMRGPVQHRAQDGFRGSQGGYGHVTQG